VLAVTIDCTRIADNALRPYAKGAANWGLAVGGQVDDLDLQLVAIPAQAARADLQPGGVSFDVRVLGKDPSFLSARPVE
jgi:hypothetical protein